MRFGWNANTSSTGFHVRLTFAARPEWEMNIQKRNGIIMEYLFICEWSVSLPESQPKSPPWAFIVICFSLFTPPHPPDVKMEIDIGWNGILHIHFHLHLAFPTPRGAKNTHRIAYCRMMPLFSRLMAESFHITHSLSANGRRIQPFPCPPISATPLIAL